MTEEENRLEEDRTGKNAWRRWGPYLSERQWGTVREDYSPYGTAWEYLPHDHARSRAYRWGEDGLAGISDLRQQLCFALAFWNGKDPILKERLFGLTGNEGNHGEDVKEYYFYLDNIPTHSYMKYLYKYPQTAYPYSQLVNVNRSRNRHEFEYELLDTGIFDDDKYYDIFIEYAKAGPEDLLIKITAANRGSGHAKLHLLPTLWFRNTWSWMSNQPIPSISIENDDRKMTVLKASHIDLGDYWLYCDQPDALLFTENETNNQRLFGSPNNSPYVKDGINDYLVKGKHDAINPSNQGTKAAVHYVLDINGGAAVSIKLRLTNTNKLTDPFGESFDNTISKRKSEADAFYQRITPFPISEDMRNIQRQAFAGLLWNKQYYHYSVYQWLHGDPNQPPPPASRIDGRNEDWWTLNASDIFSMPDKWEYPWFASWDLGFHTLVFSLIDPDFAKHQLLLMTKEWYMHPNGQLPAYEWSFGDVNPPVHAWAAMRIYQIEKGIYGRGDRDFLEKMFQKLTLNFTWWVNRKDAGGRNIFEGGFLGLDNIGAFDRTLGPPTGGTLEQADGTGWMGMYCLNLLQIALELAIENPNYEDMATKFFEHFIYIADALNNVAGHTEGLWDGEAGFYYGLLTTPDGKQFKMVEDSMSGIVPIFAVATNEPNLSDTFPVYREHFEWFVKNKPELLVHIGDLSKFDADGHLLLSLASPHKLKSMLKKVLDEDQFLSPYGIRSVSRRHAAEPFVIKLAGREFRLDYEPAESTSGLFGGNSNWRGPVWFPLNYLLIEALQQYHYYLGDDFLVEYPSKTGDMKNLWNVSSDLAYRLIKIFMKDENGRRPLYGGIEKFQNDPHWRDYILFHEYFHGDNGAGLGASNQTGWTALVAKLIRQYGQYSLLHIPPKTIEQWKIGHA